MRVPGLVVPQRPEIQHQIPERAVDATASTGPVRHGQSHMLPIRAAPAEAVNGIDACVFAFSVQSRYDWPSACPRSGRDWRLPTAPICKTLRLGESAPVR